MTKTVDSGDNMAAALYLEHLDPRELTLVRLLDRKESPRLMTRLPEIEKFRNLKTNYIWLILYDYLPKILFYIKS
jgi:hypothetical protein